MTTDARPDPLMSPLVRRAGQENSFWYADQLMSALAEGEETGGRLTVYEILLPPDSGPPLHVHECEDEAFYVLEGALRVRMGSEEQEEEEEEFEVKAGGFVFHPRGIPHAFRSSREGARVLLMVTPSGFEGFFRAMGRPAEAMALPPRSGGPPSQEQMAAMEVALVEHECKLVGEGPGTG